MPEAFGLGLTCAQRESQLQPGKLAGHSSADGLDSYQQRDQPNQSHDCDPVEDLPADDVIKMSDWEHGPPPFACSAPPFQFYHAAALFSSSDHT